MLFSFSFAPRFLSYTAKVHVDCTFNEPSTQLLLEGMISSRKSITSLLSSNSHVSLHSKARSRQGSTNHAVEFPVEEIFVQYSVPKIQKIQQEYKANFVKSKDDLHHLVGMKYRDLIRIAEDIEELSSLSRQIDSQLTDLSYKSSSYVEFGKNRFNKFDSLIRKEKAIKSRITSHKTILNNVINNKLIGFDLKLQTDSVKKTSTLVEVAKLYYTIGKSFSRTLKENPHVSGNLYQLKENFIRYLESKIASNSASSSDFSQGGLNMDDFFVANTKLDFSEGENFDLLTGTFDDDAQEASDEDEGASEIIYRGSAYPIVNYLIAYIIVNHDDPKLDSLEKITTKFIDLRYNYLESFVAQALESDIHTDKSVNFTMIFQFIEATCGCLQKFFISDDLISNDLQNQLKYIVDWKASDLIGFHNWFEEETMAFDNSSYQLLDPDAVTSSQNRLSKFAKFVHQLGSKLVSESLHGTISQNATSVLNLFYRFVYELRKAEVVFLSNNSVCHLVQLFSDEDVVPKLLQDVLDSFESYFAVHCDSLTNSDTSLISQITREFDTESSLSSAVELFTPDFVNMIDVDVDLYFNTVLEISAASNPVSELKTTGNSLQGLKHWFYVLEKLLQATNLSAESNLGIISRILKKDFREVEGLTKKWGQFTPNSFLSSFQELHQRQIDLSRSQLESFINRISSTLHSSSNPGSSRLQFLLELFIILKDNVEAVEGHPDAPRLDANISKQVLIIYEQIFSELLSVEPEGRGVPFESLLEDSFVRLSNVDSSTVPLRPHLAVHSTILELGCSLLRSPRFRQHEMCNMYTDKGVKNNFVLVKNYWIKESLIERLLISSSRKLYEASEVDVPSVSETHGNGAETENGEKKNGANSDHENEAGPDSEGENGSESKPNSDSAIEKELKEKRLENEKDMDDGWTQDEDDGWLEDLNDHSKEKGQLPVEATVAVVSEPQNIEKTSGNAAPKENASQKENAALEALTADKEVVDDLLSIEKAPSQEKKATSLESIEHARQALANVVFLLNLTTKEVISTSDANVTQYISSIEEIFGVALERSTVAIIVRGVNDFYKASKEMYLPLLVI